MKNNAYRLAVANFETLALTVCSASPAVANDPWWAAKCVEKTLRQARARLLVRLDYLHLGELADEFAGEVHSFCRKRMELNSRAWFSVAKRERLFAEGFDEFMPAPVVAAAPSEADQPSQLCEFLVRDRGVSPHVAAGFVLVRVLGVPSLVAQRVVERNSGAKWASANAFRKAVSRLGQQQEEAMRDWACRIGLV